MYLRLFTNTQTVLPRLGINDKIGLMHPVFQGIKPPEILFSADSEYNGHMEVVESGQTRKLIADGTVQSVNYESPLAQRLFWGRVVRLLQDEVPELNSVLVLGLGGGTMQHLLSKAFEHAYIVSVEIDRLAYEVAQKFFDIDAVPNHEIIIEDACKVIVEPEEFGLNVSSFNAVIVDIFNGDKYPDLGSSGNFIAHVCRLAAAGGLVVFNRFYLEHHQEDVDQFLETLEQFLRDIKTIIIPGKTNADNMLIYGRV